MLFNIAWRNLYRNKTRTLLITLLVCFCVFLMQFVNGLIISMIDDFFVNMQESTGHIQITHQKMVENDSDILPIDYPVSNVMNIEKALDENPEVEDYFSFINFGAYLVFDKYAGAEDMELTLRDPDRKPQMPVMVTGLEISKNRVKQYSKAIRTGGRYLENNNEIIIGYKIAFTLGIEVGSEVQIMTSRADSSLYYQSFNVVGLFETMVNEIDTSTIVISLNDAAHIMNYDDEVSQISIVVKDNNDSKTVSAEIQTLLNGRLKPYRKFSLSVNPQAGLQITNDPALAEQVDPVTILKVVPDTVRAWAKEYENFQRIAKSLPEADEINIWVIGNSLSTSIDVLLAGDLGIVERKWNINGHVLAGNTGLADGTIIYIDSVDANDSSGGDDELNLIEKLALRDIMDEKLSQFKINVELEFSKSEALLQKQRDVIDKLSTAIQPQQLISQSWQDFNEVLVMMLEMQDITIFIFFLIFGIVIGATISNNMMIAVFERVRELGTLRAIGWQRKDIIALIEIESFWIGLIGSTMGLILGSMLVMLVGYIGIDYGEASELIPGMSPVIRPVLDWGGSVQAFLLGLILVLLSSLIPAGAAAKMLPAKALGFVP